MNALRALRSPGGEEDTWRRTSELGPSAPVSQHAEVLDLALSDAQRFAKGPTRAYAAIKTAVREGFDLSLPGGIAVESEQFAETFKSDDARIGVAAFLDKEKPEFTGR